MSRVSKIHIKQAPQCYTVSVRKTINFMEQYAAFFAESLVMVGAYLDQHDVLTSSPPFACFHNMDLECLDVEVGFHTAQGMPCDGEISCQSYPPQKVVSAIDMGPYEKQDPTLMDLFGFIEQHKLIMQGPICYYYLNEPERPESEYLTQMVIPIK